MASPVGRIATLEAGGEAAPDQHRESPRRRLRDPRCRSGGVMHPRSLLATAAITFTLLAASPAHAVKFDVIYCDHFDLTLCDNGCGITLAGADFALFVNKSATPVDAVTFNSIHYTVTSSTPDL